MSEVDDKQEINKLQQLYTMVQLILDTIMIVYRLDCPVPKCERKFLYCNAKKLTFL